MSLISHKCVEFDGKKKRKILVAEENGKKYQLNNDSLFTIRKIKVDKCLPQGIGEKRCDFLMDSIDNKEAFFIELKGGGLSQAAKQIYATIIYLKADFPHYKINARIVGSKDVPGFINTPDYLRLEKQTRLTGGNTKRGTNNIYTESI